eukprot:7854103-Pyramimonas_sp.AAC.1
MEVWARPLGTQSRSSPLEGIPLMLSRIWVTASRAHPCGALQSLGRAPTAALSLPDSPLART